MSDEGLRAGWLVNWLITEGVTGLGGSCIQLTQSDMIAHGFIVVKEDDTHTHTRKPISLRADIIILYVVSIHKPYLTLIVL